MKVYLAGSYRNILLIDAISELFHAVDIETTSQWHRIEPIDSVELRVDIDYSDIDSSNALVATFPYGPGTASEMGYALGKGIKVIYVRPDYFTNEDPLPSGHKGCTIVNSVNAAIDLCGEISFPETE